MCSDSHRTKDRWSKYFNTNIFREIGDRSRFRSIENWLTIPSSGRAIRSRAADGGRSADASRPHYGAADFNPHGCLALRAAQQRGSSRHQSSKPLAFPSSRLSAAPLGIKEMKFEEKISIRCGTHGTRIPAIVCCHMIQAKDLAVGFVENSSDPDDLQAWCAACEQIYLEEGDKTERFKAFNDFKVVCDFCYASLRDKMTDVVNSNPIRLSVISATHH